MPPRRGAGGAPAVYISQAGAGGEFTPAGIARYFLGLPGPSGFGSRSTAGAVAAAWQGAGKVAIVTGSSGGLGAEAARALAARGCHVGEPPAASSWAAALPLAQLSVFEICSNRASYAICILSLSFKNLTSSPPSPRGARRGKGPARRRRDRGRARRRACRGAAARPRLACVGA